MIILLIITLSLLEIVYGSGTQIIHLKFVVQVYQKYQQTERYY